MFVKLIYVDNQSSTRIFNGEAVIYFDNQASKQSSKQAITLMNEEGLHVLSNTKEILYQCYAGETS